MNLLEKRMPNNHNIKTKFFIEKCFMHDDYTALKR